MGLPCRGAELLHLSSVSAGRGAFLWQAGGKGKMERILAGRKQNVSGWLWSPGLLWLGGLAGAKGVQRRAQEEEAEARYTPSLHFGSVGSEISCHWESPSLGTAGQPPHLPLPQQEVGLQCPQERCGKLPLSERHKTVSVKLKVFVRNRYSVQSFCCPVYFAPLLKVKEVY